MEGESVIYQPIISNNVTFRDISNVAKFQMWEFSFKCNNTSHRRYANRTPTILATITSVEAICVDRFYYIR